jgi:hypothetical protein
LVSRVFPESFFFTGVGRVTLPDGREIAFDLSVGPDEWVIREVNGAATQRSMISWPRLSGSITQ